MTMGLCVMIALLNAAAEFD